MSGEALVVAAVSSPPPELESQICSPVAVFAGTDALAEAVGFQAEWIWLLGAGARPRADALKRLLECVAPPDERAASLLAGMVLTPAGRPLAQRLPAGDERRLADVVRLTESRLLPIRNTTFTHTLVRRELFLRHGLPDVDRYGPYADVQWSARALRDAAGYFVPASAVVLEVREGRGPALASLPALARMLGAGAWTRGEALAAVRRVAGLATDPAPGARAADGRADPDSPPPR